jgi:hypothetical protein
LVRLNFTHQSGLCSSRSHGREAEIEPAEGDVHEGAIIAVDDHQDLHPAGRQMRRDHDIPPVDGLEPQPVQVPHIEAARKNVRWIWHVGVPCFYSK